MVSQDPYRPPRANGEARLERRPSDDQDEPASPKQIAIKAAITVVIFSAVIIAIIIALLGLRAVQFAR